MSLSPNKIGEAFGKALLLMFVGVGALAPLSSGRVHSAGSGVIYD